MRSKFAFLLSFMVALVLALPALGVPTNGANTDVIPVTCEEEDVFVIVNAGNSAWGADEDGNPDGTQYILKQIEFRGYAGDLATEPATDPLFVFGKTFGKKHGLGEAIHCTFREQEVSQEGTVTVFGDAWVVSVR
ncbi:hypothetical protein BH18ACT5_BH18ACT5_18630 [soil metagenome]